MMVKKLACAGLVLMIVMIVGAGAAWAQSSWRELVNWQSYDDAYSGKYSSDRKVFIYFFSKRCGYCRMLEKNAFTNKTIVDYLNKHYTPILVDSDIERELAMRSGVNGVPDLRFLTSKREPIARLPGYVPPETLLNLLQYIQTDSYKTMALNDFVKKKNGN